MLLKPVINYDSSPSELNGEEKSNSNISCPNPAGYLHAELPRTFSIKLPSTGEFQDQTIWIQTTDPGWVLSLRYLESTGMVVLAGQLLLHFRHLQQVPLTNQSRELSHYRHVLRHRARHLLELRVILHKCLQRGNQSNQFFKRKARDSGCVQPSDKLYETTRTDISKTSAGIQMTGHLNPRSPQDLSNYKEISGRDVLFIYS